LLAGAVGDESLIASRIHGDTAILAFARPSLNAFLFCDSV